MRLVTLCKMSQHCAARPCKQARPGLNGEETRGGAAGPCHRKERLWDFYGRGRCNAKATGRSSCRDNGGQFVNGYVPGQRARHPRTRPPAGWAPLGAGRKGFGVRRLAILAMRIHCACMARNACINGVSRAMRAS